MVTGPYGVTKDCGTEREYPDYWGAPYMQSQGSLREKQSQRWKEVMGGQNHGLEVLSFEDGGAGYAPRNSCGL